MPLEPLRHTIQVSNSRFLAHVEAVESLDAMRRLVARLRLEFPDARHHVPAAVLGHGRNAQSWCSDDGEPSGTAGRPMLAVLKGSGLGDTGVVVVRWFGGTLLGTGGLVKAYGDACREALARVRRGHLEAVEHWRVTLAYPHYDRARIILEGAGVDLAREDFGEGITLDIAIPPANGAALWEALDRLCSGPCPRQRLGEGTRIVPLS